MTLGDLRRLALDIEVLTTAGFEFPNAAREGDRIIAIALADSTGWSTVLSGAEMDEAELLRACTRLIAERDPDVLEGHNIFRFDLEYLEARARRHRVALAWGRDGSAPPRPSLAHAGRRAHDRLPALRRGGAPHRGHLDARPALRRGRPRPRLLRAQGRGAALRRRRSRPDLSPRRGHPAHLPRGPGAADGLRARRRAGDARGLRHPVSALLRSGAGPALRLRVGGAPRQRDQDRRPAPPRVSASRPGGAPRGRRPLGGRRLHRGVPAGRGGERPARGRHLPLPLAHAHAGHHARRRWARDLRRDAPRPPRVPGRGQAAGARGGHRGRPPPAGRAPADLQDPHQLVLRISRERASATGTTSRRPTASPRRDAASSPGWSSGSRISAPP